MTSKDIKLCKVEAAIRNAPFLDPDVYKECELDIRKFHIANTEKGFGEFEYIQARKNAKKDTVTVCICCIKGAEEIYVFMNTKTYWETVLFCIDRSLKTAKGYISSAGVALYDKEQYVSFTIEFED